MVDSWECAARWKLHFHPLTVCTQWATRKYYSWSQNVNGSVVSYGLTLRWNTFSLTSGGVSVCFKLLAMSQSKSLKSLLIGWKMKSIKEAKWHKPAVFLLIVSHLNVKSEPRMVSASLTMSTVICIHAHIEIPGEYIHSPATSLSALTKSHIVCFFIYREKQNSVIKNASILCISNNKQV